MFADANALTTIYANTSFNANEIDIPSDMFPYWDCEFDYLV